MVEESLTACWSEEITEPVDKAVEDLPLPFFRQTAGAARACSDITVQILLHLFDPPQV